MGKYLAWGHDILSKGNRVHVSWLKAKYFPNCPNQIQSIGMTSKSWKLRTFFFKVDRMYMYSKERSTLDNDREDSIIKTFAFCALSQNKKLIIHWEAQLIFSFALFQVEVHISIYIFRKCKRAVWVQGLTTFSGPAHASLFSPAHISFHYGFLWNCVHSARWVK